MLTESAARWMLVLHTVLGAAAVGAATHLVLWTRGYLRGNYGRHRAVRRFALYSLILHAAAFVAGNAMYPTYRIQVRAAYFENAKLLTDEAEARQQALETVAAREGADIPQPAPSSQIVQRDAKAVRWFDVKEHWVALGLLASLGLVLVLAFWDPRQGSPSLAPVVMGLAGIVALTVWLGAIIGVLTASLRAL